MSIPIRDLSAWDLWKLCQLCDNPIHKIAKEGWPATDIVTTERMIEVKSLLIAYETGRRQRILRAMSDVVSLRRILVLCVVLAAVLLSAEGKSSPGKRMFLGLKETESLRVRSNPPESDSCTVSLATTLIEHGEFGSAGPASVDEIEALSVPRVEILLAYVHRAPKNPLSDDVVRKVSALPALGHILIVEQEAKDDACSLAVSVRQRVLIVEATCPKEETLPPRFSLAMLTALQGAADANDDGRVTLQEALAEVAAQLGTGHTSFQLGDMASLVLTRLDGRQRRVSFPAEPTQTYEIRPRGRTCRVATVRTRPERRTTLVVPSGDYSVVRSDNRMTTFGFPHRGTKTLSAEDFTEEASGKGCSHPHLIRASIRRGLAVRSDPRREKLVSGGLTATSLGYGYAFAPNGWFYGGVVHEDYDTWDGASDGVAPSKRERWLLGEVGVKGVFSESPTRGYFFGGLYSGALVDEDTNEPAERKIQFGMGIEVGLEFTLAGWTRASAGFGSHIAIGTFHSFLGPSFSLSTEF